MKESSLVLSRSQVTTMTRIDPFKDVLHAPELTFNLLSLRALTADNFELHGKGEYIPFCGVSLRFPPKDDLYCLYSFPITKEMLRTMPYIRDNSIYGVWHDTESISVREDIARQWLPRVTRFPLRCISMFYIRLSRMFMTRCSLSPKY